MLKNFDVVKIVLTLSSLSGKFFLRICRWFQILNHPRQKQIMSYDLDTDQERAVNPLIVPPHLVGCANKRARAEYFRGRPGTGRRRLWQERIANQAIVAKKQEAAERRRLKEIRDRARARRQNMRDYGGNYTWH